MSLRDPIPGLSGLGVFGAGSCTPQDFASPPNGTWAPGGSPGDYVYIDGVPEPTSGLVCGFATGGIIPAPLTEARVRELIREEIAAWEKRTVKRKARRA